MILQAPARAAMPPAVVRSIESMLARRVIASVRRGVARSRRRCI